MKIAVRCVVTAIFAELLCVMMFITSAQLFAVSAPIGSGGALKEFDSHLVIEDPHAYRFHTAIPERNTIAKSISFLSNLEMLITKAGCLLVLSPIIGAAATLYWDNRTRKQPTLKDELEEPNKNTAFNLATKLEPILDDEQSGLVISICTILTVAFCWNVSSNDDFTNLTHALELVGTAACLYIVFPIPLVLAGSLFAVRKMLPRQLRWRYALSLAPAFLPIASLSWGAHFWHQTASHDFEYNSTSAYIVLQILFLAFFPASLLVLYLLRGYKVFCTVLLINELYLCIIFNALASLDVAHGYSYL